MTRIASIGEALIDFTPVERDGRLAGFDLHVGGSPYNVAVGLARLGQETLFAGRISADIFGEVLAAHLSANGVSAELLLRGTEPTALAFVSLDQGDPAYAFRWEGTADRELRASDLAGDRLAGLDALHFGSVAVALEPCGTAIEELQAMLAGRVFLSFDPNVRPVVIEDWAAYRRRVERCVAAADLVKVSRTDLEALAVGDPSRWFGLWPGPAAIVVTDGPRGSLVLRRGRRPVESQAIPARLVDAVGAGDAYMSGLLSALAMRGALTRPALLALDELDWREIGLYASTAAALACERAGADPPHAWEVQARLTAGSPAGAAPAVKGQDGGRP